MAGKSEITLLPIGTGWEAGDGADFIPKNPANGADIAILQAASLAQVDHAVASAREVFNAGEWAGRAPHEKANCLHKAAALMRARMEKLAALQTLENGKTLKESKAQVASAAGIVQYFAAVVETAADELPPRRGDYISISLYEPCGVVAAITPWNSPLTMAAQKIAPALAAGNVVILKPSEVTTLVSLELVRCFIDAGLPAGQVQLLAGFGDVGAALTGHAQVDMISFTGGTNAGRMIAKSAAERFVPVVLELGGKSPNIVFADADLGAAAKGVASAIFGSGGQSCVAGSRCLIEAPVYEKFMAMLMAEAEKFVVGDPQDSNSVIGPMASFAQRQRVEDYVAIARREGARIRIGGTRPEGAAFDSGAYYLPTIIDGLDHASTVAQEEIFGSVLCAFSFDGPAEAIRLADDTVYGLACGIWSADHGKAWSVGRAVGAGTVWINDYKQLSIAAPFGGYKDSGVGREKGIQGMRAYQQMKSLYLGGYGV